MPGINPPDNNLLPYYIAQMNNRLRAVETQQQMILTNLQGQPIIAFGLQPGSNPAQYGMAVLAQAFGTPIAFFGEDVAGDVALKFYGTSGDVLIQIDPSGLTQFDSSGNTRVQFGLLPNGDYALAFYSLANDGSFTELLPAVDSYVDATLSTTSTAFAPITGSPSVVATLGASGDFEVTAGSFVGTASAGGEATAALVIDGAVYSASAIVGISSGSTVAGNVQSTRRWKEWTVVSGGAGLTPGAHTFGLQYAVTVGQGNFSANFLKIQPV